MTRYELEQTEYDALADTPQGQAILAGACPSAAWKPLPAAPVAPPMRPELLPPVLRSMAEAIAANQNVPLDLPALVGLGVASACACGRIGVQLKAGWYEPAQLFLLGVLDSGEGKTPVFKSMTRTLFLSQADENKRRAVKIEADKAELEVLFARKNEAVKKKQTREARAIAEEIAAFPAVRLMNRFIGGDVTPERITEIMQNNDGATAQLDDEGELFELLEGRYQDMPNLNPWLKGYSGGVPFAMERKGGSTIVENPNLSVLVLAQHYILGELLGAKRMSGKGFLARFLIACPEPVREYGAEPDIPAAVTSGYEAALRQLLAIKSATLALTPEARTVFFAWRDEVRARQWTDWLPLKRDGFSAKLAGNTARLACLLKLWEDTGTDEPIDAETMRNAVALARYFVGHMLHLLEGEGSLTSPAKETLDLLVKVGEPVQREREIKQALTKRRMFPSGEAVDAAFDELARAGYIRRVEVCSGGRPSPTVELNPELLPKREAVEL
ncbi:MAG: DUF3987 domain-containing protein [Clostridiales bacterium]|nr:DUF3987 domain-containing protein [Clostridiales bacterium]